MADVESLDLEGLSESDRAALERLVLSLADSKRMMGIRYSDWLLGAPSIETGIAASSMAQDEWGHARLLYAMLKDLDIDPVEVEHDRAPEQYASVAALDEEMPDWAALVAAMVLVDGALTSVLDHFSRGTFEPARNRVPKMVVEEEFHASLAAAWFKRLAETDGEARELLHAGASAMLPSVVAWVGADDESARAMVAAGVISPAADRLATYRDAVRDLLSLLDIEIDAVDPAGDWDPVRGRTGGAPDEEAIVRVRGDRNRALFVE